MTFFPFQFDCWLPSTVSSRKARMVWHQWHLLADLLQGGHPVLDVIGGRQLPVPYSEYVDRHGVETLARRLRTPEFASGRSRCFAAHDDLIADGQDVFDRPAQIGDSRSDRLEHFGED